jgi:hypothetical protein
MTMEEVKRNEYATLELESTKTNNLIYLTTLNRYDVALKYHFINNKLVVCSYSFFLDEGYSEKKLNSNNLEYCRSIYDNIHKLLKDKYGKTRLEINTEGDTIKPPPDILELLNEVGAAGFGCKAIEFWDVEGTTICLSLGYFYDDMKPPYDLTIIYKSIQYESLIESERFSEF